MSFFTLTSSSNSIFKRAVRAFFLVVGLLLFIAAAISFVIDVEEVYLKKYLADKELERYVSGMVESDNGVVYSSVERGVKYQLANFSDAECYALGSSRAMQISLRKESWISDNCASLANLGVSGGSLEDIIVYSSIIYGREKSKLFYVVDPWMLKFDSDVQYMEFDDEYQDFVLQLGGAPRQGENFLIKKAENLINYDYVKASYDSIMNNGWDALPSLSRKEINFADEFDWRTGYSQAVTLPDGSHVYANSYINGAEDRDLINGGYRNYRLQHYYIEEDAADLFYSLSEKMSSDQSLHFVLTPFHPTVFSEENNDFVNKVEYIESRIREIADELGIVVIGSYNPFLAGCSEEEFLDAIHPVFDCIESLDAN